MDKLSLRQIKMFLPALYYCAGAKKLETCAQEHGQQRLFWIFDYLFLHWMPEYKKYLLLSEKISGILEFS